MTEVEELELSPQRVDMGVASTQLIPLADKWLDESGIGTLQVLGSEGQRIR